MKKVIVALIIFALALYLTPFMRSVKALPDNTNARYPVLIKETARTVSFPEITSGLEKTEGLNSNEVTEYIINKEKTFEKLHPGLFISYSDPASGHYEYMQFSRYEYFGKIHWLHYGAEQSSPIVIQQSVYAEVYVYGSFRQFVWVSNPFTATTINEYKWYPTYNHTRQESPTQFTVMSSGYAEVATNLKGASFGIFYPHGGSYYYRKNCDFLMWTYSLHNY